MKKTLLQTILYGLLAFPVWGMVGGIESENLQPGGAGSVGLSNPLTSTLEGNGNGFNVGPSTASSLIVTGNLTIVGNLTQFGPAVTRATETVIYYITQPDGVSITTITFSTNGYITVAFGGVEKTVLYSTAGVIGGSGGVQAGDSTTFTGENTWVNSSTFSGVTYFQNFSQFNSSITVSSNTLIKAGVQISSQCGIAGAAQLNVINNSGAGEATIRIRLRGDDAGTIVGDLIAVSNSHGGGNTYGQMLKKVILENSGSASLGVAMSATAIGSEFSWFAGGRAAGNKIASLNNIGFAVGASSASSRLDINNGSITVRGTGSAIFINAPAGTAESVLIVATGTTNLLKVSGSSIQVGVDIYLSDTKYANPDYVFEDSYDLMSLDELETFTRTNKHLPGVPSTSEVRKRGGVSIFEQNRLLHEKVEELTRHLFNLNNRLKEIEGR